MRLRRLILLDAIGGGLTKGPLVLALAIAFLAGVTGCGGDLSDASDSAASAGAGGSAPAASLHGDMVAAVSSLGSIPVDRAFSSGGGAGQPKVIYLVYADGTQLPQTSYDACTSAAPKFNCTFAPTLEECERQIQTYLDRWYADFNVIFTLTRPASGSYYTEVVSSGGGAWCGVASTVAGVSPLVCQPLNGGVSYTLDGGHSAHDTAVIIAHEQAHLVGLEHVSDTDEIMYPDVCQNCDGFLNTAAPVMTDRCNRQTQNSYQMMLTGLGAWGGGPKPSVFTCIDDKQAPTVTFMSPENGAVMGHDFSVKADVRDDCDLVNVAIDVAPQGLSANARTGPYQWDLTGIDGAQTITVTATDGKGNATVATLQVSAPSAGDVATPTSSGAAGCTVASGAFGAAGLLPSLTVLLVFAGRAHRSGRRRRVIPGALAPGRWRG